MGTALAVSPFNLIPNWSSMKNVPKVLFNINNTHQTGGFDFSKGEERLFVKGKCDEMITQFCKDAGLYDDFQATLPDFHKSKL